MLKNDNRHSIQDMSEYIKEFPDICQTVCADGDRAPVAVGQFTGFI